ncbi:MAG TPA: sulfotransferase [Verrucomicrobiae bacterium]|nr:sulfotransferase [Verrucomicrobiae bacterium]
MAPAVNGDLAKLQSVPRETARWQKAQNQLMSGRYGHALAAYRSLVQSYPSIAQLWFELGIAAGGELDFQQAHDAFQRAIALASDDVSLLVLIGQQYQRLRRLDLARDSYQRAVLADPGSTHARLSLAAWYERERRMEEAWNCVEESLAHRPKDAQALYFKAFLLHRKGMNPEAEAILRELIRSAPQEAGVKHSSRHLLATVLDELGQYDEAMKWLIEAKSLLRQMVDAASLERIYDQTDRQRRELLKGLTPETIKRWRDEGTRQAEEHKLAFLGGHPRSGTTLLEQVLGAHPEIIAFDEPEAFTQEIFNELSPVQSARGLTLDTLNGLSAATRAALSQRYFKSLLREVNGPVTGRLLLDKNPSPTASLHVWLRIFPKMKVIIPIRDPRDVVISCFFQNLTMTSASVSFLSLERTARHFADLMDVWLRMKELGGFDWTESRYETMVENLEAEGKRVTEFLGLAWEPSQAHYRELTRQHFVFAPTYHDVTKPVHKRAVRRWEHYANALAPVMDKLTPYCRAFGYE